jgi:hypothetical protein
VTRRTDVREIAGGVIAMKRLQPKPHTEDCQSLLVDLYDLLEAYAPPWYSHELRKRLLAQRKSLDTQRKPLKR